MSAKPRKNPGDRRKKKGQVMARGVREGKGREGRLQLGVCTLRWGFMEISNKHKILWKTLVRLCEH